MILPAPHAHLTHSFSSVWSSSLVSLELLGLNSADLPQGSLRPLSGFTRLKDLTIKADPETKQMLQV